MLLIFLSLLFIVIPLEGTTINNYYKKSFFNVLGKTFFQDGSWALFLVKKYNTKYKVVQYINNEEHLLFVKNRSMLPYNVLFDHRHNNMFYKAMFFYKKYQVSHRNRHLCSGLDPSSRLKIFIYEVSGKNQDSIIDTYHSKQELDEGSLTNTIEIDCKELNYD